MWINDLPSLARLTALLFCKTSIFHLGLHGTNMAEKDIQAIAKRSIQQEAESLRGLLQYIDNQFEQAVLAIADCTGRLVVSGIGKSALISQKIVATLNSTGTAASFMHAADAIHGDLGMIQQDDIVMVISKSGESPEIKVLVPLIKNFGNKLIAMTGNLDSYLSRQADFILNTTVDQEACPNNLAPTCSTTAQLAMGDALAVCLMEWKGFSTDDFAKFHPGGMLGKKLYLRVADLFMKNAKPQVSLNSSLREVIVAITKNRLGATAVLDEQKKLVGIVTDGDLRRMLEKGEELAKIKAGDIMSHNPKAIEAEQLAVSALDLMRKNDISQLIVTEQGNYAGIIHLHDLVREGII